ncbi:MAG: hypothetical protein MUF07_10805 [Steroidobacteraceae bacterium]|jgi:hypothetical protein|nr:hypothetical protein [Steroidobacteraceae bacterium]
MSLFVRGSFVIVGLVNLYPLAGVLGADALQALYGRGLDDAELLLLMRHRAVLFGLLGMLLVAAAWRASWRGPATFAGLASMLAFVWLAGDPRLLSPALARVYVADLAASAWLVAAWLVGAWHVAGRVGAGRGARRE